MLTALDRLTIYSVLCFISFCAMVLSSPTQGSVAPLIGVVATIIGMWLEMHKWSGASEQNH